MKRFHIDFGLALAVLFGLIFAPVWAVSPSRVESNQLIPPIMPIPASFFGMHIQHAMIINRAAPLTPWPSVPVPSWRLWDAQVTWPELEPSKGQWQFETLDRYVTIAEQHDTEIILTLGFTPAWASARPQEPVGYKPGWAAGPKSIEDWKNYVRTIATRYKGRIHNYEIWNEPNLTKMYWTGSMDQMIALTREAHDVIKGVDPDAVLISPSATVDSGITWLSDFLGKGGGQYVDVIGYHFYVTPQPPEAMVLLIQRVKKVMLSSGVGGKPLWNTESGWSDPKPFPSEDVAAGYLARAFILNWAAGVQRFYWFAWDNHDWVSLQTTQKDNKTLTPAGRAYGIIQEWLVGARMTGCSEDGNHTWICQLERNGSSQWIIWDAGKIKLIDLPSSWHVKYVTSLLQERSESDGLFLKIGPIPQLLTSRQ